MSTLGKLLIGGAVLTGLYFYGKSKIDSWKSVLPKLKAIPTGISKIRFEDGKFKCNLKVTIYNPTSQDFNPDLIATLKKVVIIADGASVAEIGVNKSHLYIPALGRTTLEDLNVEIPVASNFEKINYLLKLKVTDFKVRGVVSILGSEYFI